MQAAEAQHGLKDTVQLLQVHHCTIESILTGCITAWYSSCTALNRKALQRVVKAAQHITTRTESCHPWRTSTPSAWPIRLALTTCLFFRYHDNAHHARPTPYGCYGNAQFLLADAGEPEQINQKHRASRRQSEPERNRAKTTDVQKHRFNTCEALHEFTALPSLVAGHKLLFVVTVELQGRRSGRGEEARNGDRLARGGIQTACSGVYSQRQRAPIRAHDAEKEKACMVWKCKKGSR
ncbi:hypothetical protein L3Q82_001302 [Scortum barcoo]|uniref:Uncharacterized protein n=1 Tax=Scortum barcoo TaxID=214431 RepID=A0ACB8W7B2_9TELE|nr:hypothetical protein L3Q82_001302 [Scortum barcoo]